MRELTTLDAVVRFVSHADEPIYVRFSRGTVDDHPRRSVDHETGLVLPGLAVNRLCPPAWWCGRSVEEWVIRQISTYAHLQEHDDERRCWLLAGAIVDTGP